jgi:WD40 repeat protein
MPRAKVYPGNALPHYVMAACLACVLFGQDPAAAQDKPSAAEQELRRQLLLERAARKSLTYQADMRKAALLAESQNWRAVSELLDQYRPAAGESDLRSWEWHFLESLVKKKKLVDRQELVLEGPNEGIRLLAWSGNGERLAAVGDDGSVVIWDRTTAKELRRVGSKVRFISLDHAGRRITLSAENGTVTLWDTDKGPARRFFGPIKGLSNFRQPAFSPDGRMLALAVERTAAAIYDTSTGLELHRLAGHDGFVSAVIWHPGGKMLATGSHDGMVRIWDASTGTVSRELDADDDVEGLQWGAGGKQIAAVTSHGQGTGQVRIWDVASGKKQFGVDAQYGTTWRPNQPRAGLFFSADGKRAAAEAIGGVVVWETGAGRAIFQGPTGSSGSQLGGCDPQVRRWAFLQMFGSRATCRVVNIETSADLLRVESEIPMNNYGSALAWSPDGQYLAAGFAQGKIYIYGVPADRPQVRFLSAGPAPVFEWSPDGRRFAYSADGDVRIGSLPVTEPPVRLGIPRSAPSVVSLSPDGVFLAGCEYDGAIPVWNIASGQISQRLPGHPVPVANRSGEVGLATNALLWSPDARWLVSVRWGDGGLRIWDVKAGTLMTSFQFGSHYFDASQHEGLPLSWSPDSTLLAMRSGSSQKRISVIEVTTGKQIADWDGGPALGSSSAIAWDPTSRKIATCLGNPPRIQIRDVATAKEAFALDVPVVGLNRMSWSPDGRRLAFQAERVQIYDFSTARVTTLAGTAEQLLWNSDGSRLALVGNGSFSTRYGSRDVELYDATTGAAIPGERRAAFPDAAAGRAESRGVDVQNYQIQSAVWNARGMFAAASAKAEPVMPIIVVWDIRTGKPLLTLGPIGVAPAGRPSFVRTVSWSADGRLLATLSGDSHSTAQIRIWDAVSGRNQATIAAGRTTFRGAAAMALSPDGRNVAFAGQPVQLWNLALPRVPLTLQQPRKNAPESDHSFLAWSSDSRSLAVLECRETSGHEQVMKAWDLTTGKEQFRGVLPYEFCYLNAPVAWSPDGKQLAWGGPRPGVWDVISGKEAFTLAGHSAAVRDVAWSADGRRVLSRCEVLGPFTRTFELKVWDAATSQEVMMFRSPMAGWRPAPGFQALAAPPGMGSDPGDVIVWDLAPRT